MRGASAYSSNKKSMNSSPKRPTTADRITATTLRAGADGGRVARDPAFHGVNPRKSEPCGRRIRKKGNRPEPRYPAVRFHGHLPKRLTGRRRHHEGRQASVSTVDTRQPFKVETVDHVGVDHEKPVCFHVGERGAESPSRSQEGFFLEHGKTDSPGTDSPGSPDAG